MIKMTRVLRLQKLIMYLNSTDDIKNTLNFIKTILTIFLYLHIKACIWFFVINREKLWYPTNWSCPACVEDRDFYQKEYKELQTKFLIDQFILSYYSSILEMMGNDINPTSGLEIFMVIIGLFTGCFMNAYIFGNLIVQLQNMNRKR